MRLLKRLAGLYAGFVLLGTMDGVTTLYGLREMEGVVEMNILSDVSGFPSIVLPYLIGGIAVTSLLCFSVIGHERSRSLRSRLGYKALVALAFSMLSFPAFTVLNNIAVIFFVISPMGGLIDIVEVLIHGRDIEIANPFLFQMFSITFAAIIFLLIALREGVPLLSNAFVKEIPNPAQDRIINASQYTFLTAALATVLVMLSRVPGL